MSAEATFLAVIRDDPNDSDARQVYADYLEQQGDLRSELLRLHDYLRQQTPCSERHAEEVSQLRSLAKDWLHQGERVDFNGMNAKQRRNWLDQLGIFTSPLATDHVGYIDMQRKTPHIVCRFHARWSGPCRQFQAVYREVAQRLAPWCVFLDADVDDNGDWARQMKIVTVPSVLISRQERLEPLLQGVTTIDRLLASIEDWLRSEIMSS